MRKKFERDYPAHWKQHFVQGVSSYSGEEYKLEIVEFYGHEVSEFNLVYIPGYTQNAYSFDLIPEEEVSLARWVDSHFQCQQFVIHPNGIGYSEYLKGSIADEIALDDIRLALEFIKKISDKPIYLFGHSNGTIASKAYLSGLTKHGFNQRVARERQASVSGAIFSAGNVCMSFKSKLTYLHFLGLIGHLLYPFLMLIGWINLSSLIKVFESINKRLGSFNVGTCFIWNFLYLIKNVSRKAQLAIYHDSIDGVSTQSLWQYSQALFSRSMKSRSGEYFVDHLENIEVPIVQVTYERDTLAPPKTTKRDDFNHIRSKQKLFIDIPGQGHEDFMMNSEFHGQFKQVFDYLLTSD